MESRELLVLAALVMLCGDALAQSDVSPEKRPRPTTRAFSLSVAPTLDGDVAGDPAWQGVVPATGFTQVQPYEGEPASQRTAVYIGYTDTSLYIGVIAYELLAGHLPYDVKQKMIHEAVRMIREDDPAPLSSIDRVFRGDIEIIVAKALEKERERRYQTVGDFATDIRRYLNDEPIDARPPSTWYQVSKFAKRNRALVGAVVAILVVLLAGVVGTS
ncbi:MAG: hypothetical protein IIC12_04035, partial [Proteobacteria bacterium]|nr:hypothetical protein [Pseudomonadota bacterium]